jgi:signal transduction histidine kinase
VGDRFGAAWQGRDPESADRRIAARLEHAARGLVTGGFAVALVRSPQPARWTEALGESIGRGGGRLVHVPVAMGRLHRCLLAPVAERESFAGVPVGSVLSGEPAPYVLVADTDPAGLASIVATGRASKLAASLRPMPGVLVVLVLPGGHEAPGAMSRMDWLLGAPVSDAPFASDDEAAPAVAAGCRWQVSGDRRAAFGAARGEPTAGDAGRDSPDRVLRGWDEPPHLPLRESRSPFAATQAPPGVDAAIAATVFRVDDAAERWIAQAASDWLGGVHLDRVSCALRLAAVLCPGLPRAAFALAGVSLSRVLTALTDGPSVVDAPRLARWDSAAAGARDACAPGAGLLSRIEARAAVWLASPDAADGRAPSGWPLARVALRAFGTADWIEGLRLADRASGAGRVAAVGFLLRLLASRLESTATGCAAGGVFDYRVLALRAEADALSGANRSAMSRFHAAIDRAMAQGRVADAALIAQRAASAAERVSSLMTVPLQEAAHALQLRSGAASRARHMARRWPEIRGARDPLAPELESGTYPIGAGALTEALQAIGGEIDAARVADMLLRQVMEHAACRYAALVLETGGRLHPYAQRAQSPELLLDDDHGLERDAPRAVLVARAMHLRRTVSGRERVEPSADTVGEPAFQARYAAAMAVPLTSGGVCLGALYFETSDGRGELAAARRRLVELFAAQAANAMANARLFEQLESSRRDLRRVNRRIEETVIERTRQLEDSYRETARLEQLRAADQERERLVRELHDGMGSQLFAMVHAIEGGRFDASSMREAVVACIADMRILLDAAGADGGDLLNAWASFRVRMQPQLESCGLSARWTLRASHDVLELGAPSVLNVMRIAQEAIANAIRHAGATAIEIALLCDTDRVVLTVADDGTGMSGASGGGRGLANMRARAEALGGELRVEGSADGVRVVLSLARQEG